MTNRHPYRFERGGRMWTTLVLLLLGATMVSLAESNHWVMELFAHFRLQYLVAAVVALLISLLTGQRAALVASLAAVAINGWFVGNYVLNIGVQAAAAPTEHPSALRILHANVQYHSQPIGRLLQRARAEQADILLIQELNNHGASVLSTAQDYPYRSLFPQEHPYGIGIVSRTPVEVTAEQDSSGLYTFLTARIPWGDTKLNLVYLHPPPPLSAQSTQIRDDLLQRIAARVRHSTKVLVVGDINNTPWTRSFARFVATSRMRPLRNRLPMGTWPQWLGFEGGFLTRLQIDHVFTRNARDIQEFRVLPDIGSEHMPVLVRLTSA